MAFALLITTFFLGYREVVAGLVRDWLHDSNYSHGLLVMPVIAWVLWQRRHALIGTPRRPSVWGLALVLAGA